LTVAGVSSEPERRSKPSVEALAEMREAVEKEPRTRRPRLELVRGLVRAGDLQGAEAAAKEWRAHDAYNLVAVRLLGDIQTELGDRAAARRTYSSIVELLPKDVEARRALATVLKQGGDLEGARRELSSVLELRPDDRRVAFELGDVEHRLGHLDEAQKRFESTAGAPEVDEGLRYPAKQRLAQIHQQTRRTALAAKDEAAAARETRAIEALGIQGGLENDVKIFLSWDTDRTDVDLWVTTPRGEKVFYSHARGGGGEELFHDVTSGYGPESFTVHAASAGEYTVQVNYFGARSGDFKEARGEVVIVLDEGRPTQREQTFPYRLFEQGDTVTVAKVRRVGGAS
jgi:Flp pilus assembly protein TadD